MTTTIPGQGEFTDTPEHNQDATGGWTLSDAEAHAEQAVLGAMMHPVTVTGSDGLRTLTSPTVGDVRAIIGPDDLFNPKHQDIMRALCTLDDQGKPGIDAIMVAAELEHQGQLRGIGLPYLHTLLAAPPTTANGAYYAEVVREAADRRATISYGIRVQQLARTTDPADLPAVLDRAHADYLTRTSRPGTRPLLTVGESRDTIDGLLASWGMPAPGSMTTGIADIDAVLNDDNGGMVVIAARSGVGKSITGAQIARHYALDRKEIAAYFCAEMTRPEMMERDLCALASVRMDSASGRTEPSRTDHHNLAQAAERYVQDGGDNLIYDDTPGLSVDYIRARAREIKRARGSIGLVVVDQLNIMTMPKADREDQAIGEVTRALKLLAQELSCIVVLIAQLNRQPEARPGGRPKAADLRSSDRIVQDADVVMLIHDVGQYDEARQGEMDVILDKQRKGVSHVAVAVADRRHVAMLADLSAPGHW